MPTVRVERVGCSAICAATSQRFGHNRQRVRINVLPGNLQMQDSFKRWPNLPQEQNSVGNTGEIRLQGQKCLHNSRLHRVWSRLACLCNLLNGDSIGQIGWDCHVQARLIPGRCGLTQIQNACCARTLIAKAAGYVQRPGGRRV